MDGQAESNMPHHFFRVVCGIKKIALIVYILRDLYMNFDDVHILFLESQLVGFPKSCSFCPGNEDGKETRGCTYIPGRLVYQNSTSEG